MPRIRLLHWKAAEAAHHLELLRRAGHEVEYQEQFEPALMRSWRESPPDAFVIDLSRLPSHGREIAIALRQSPPTRRVPIVFVGGAREKVDRIQSELPDALYCTLARLASTLQKALANPPHDPVKPVQMMERYAGRTAAQKLGINSSSVVKLINAPRDLKVLDELPTGVEVVGEDGRKPDVTLCFVHDAPDVQPTLSRVRKLAAVSKLWILWRKGGSAARGDVTERLVRETGIALGLVDYKICSVDEVWSALLFANKR